eukprot:157127-Chlamydomonas_euryale.AAC.1
MSRRRVGRPQSQSRRRLQRAAPRCLAHLLRPHPTTLLLAWAFDVDSAEPLGAVEPQPGAQFPRAHAQHEGNAWGSATTTRPRRSDQSGRESVQERPPTALRPRRQRVERSNSGIRARKTR